MTIDRIGAFEEANLIAVDVWGLDGNGCVEMLQPTKLTEEASENVNLLFIENDTTNHYCLITDLKKLLHSCSPVKS